MFVVNSVSGQVGINCTPTLCTIQVNAADAFMMPVGNTAQRPGTASNGMIRSELLIRSIIESAGGSAWFPAAVAKVNQNLSIAAGVIAWNGAAGSFANVTLTSNSANVANPTSIVPGDYYLKIQQDATGSRVINSWGSSFYWPGGVVPVLTANANAVDVLMFVSDGINMYGTYINNLRV